MEAIIFIGIPASGKSTLYHEKFADTHLRINLDMLKTRSREKILLDAVIKMKQPIVIDNTNVTANLRSAYLITLKAVKFTTIAYFFVPDFKLSVERNKNRKTKVPLVAIKAMAKHLEIPTYAEGFDKIYEVTQYRDDETFHISLKDKILFKGEF